MRRFLAAAAVLGALLIVPVAAPPAHADTGTAQVWAGSVAGNRALNWAEVYAAGHWYGWGGVGPSVFDCSGTVYAAFGHADGIWLPRTTYAMLGSGHLHRVYFPQRGDLAFYGSGHVEIVTAWYHTTFGAQQTGTRVGWHTWSGWWAPTMFYRIW